MTALPRLTFDVYQLGGGLSLIPVAIGLLQEVAFGSGRPLGGLSPEELAEAIKAVPLYTSEMSSIDRARASTEGGRTDPTIRTHARARKL